MKKSTISLSMSSLALLLLASPSAVAAINVMHLWTMGDSDGGVAGSPAGATITDMVGGTNVTRTGSPVYAGINGSIGVDFNNTGSAHNVAATEYYSSVTGDVNPVDAARWGFEAIVRINLLPASNQELAVLELGAGTNGILLQTFGNGAWGIHQSNVAITNSTSAVKVGERQHLAAVRSNGRWELYVDGLLAASFPSPDYDPAAGIRIGAGSAGTGDNRGFNGIIDTARVFGYTGTFDINQTLYAVPEPTGVALMALGGLVLLRRRRLANPLL